MHSQSAHPDTTPVVRNVGSFAHCQPQEKRGRSGNSQHPPAKSCISAPVGERDSSQGESSIPSTLQGQNSTPSSLLNNSRVADINQCVTSTPAATLRRSTSTSTAMPCTCSRSTTALGRTSTHHVVSNPASGNVLPPTPLRGLENLPTPISNPEARAIITNPLRTRATQMIHR